MLETSWLNWTRNGLIASVSGMALYTGTKVEKKEDFFITKLMFGVGLVFFSSGTVQYSMALLALESNPQIIMWGIGNAWTLLSMYGGSLYLLLDHCETKIALVEAQRGEVASHKDKHGVISSNH